MKTTATTILLSIIFSASFAQLKSDIGLRATVGYDKQVSFDYRWYNKDSLRFVVGADYVHTNIWPSNPQVVDASNTFVKFESRHESIARPNFRFGIEKTLKKHPNVYFGVSVLTGYTQRNYHTSFHVDTLTENGQWQPKELDIDELPNTTSFKEHFISAGGLLVIGWDVPITERFLINLNLAQTLTAEMQVGPTNPAQPERINLLNADTRLGLGLRYLLE